MPTMFLFTLNKDTEQAKRSSLQDQDMVKPDHIRESMESNVAMLDEFDESSYNFDSFMYCVVCRFDVLAKPEGVRVNSQ